MDPVDSPTLDEMRQQVLQSMLEHQIVVQSLHAICLVCFAFVLTLGLLSFYLYTRLVYLQAASLEQVKRHYGELKSKDDQHLSERRETDKRHSLELHANGMQMLHAFENIVSAKRAGSAG